MTTITIEIEEQTLEKLEIIAAKYNKTVEQYIIFFLEYCGEPCNREIVIEMFKQWKSEEDAAP